MKKAKLFFSVLLALLAVSASAQNITVAGVVSDATTGEAIPFASVVLKGTTNGVSADADGIFSISAPANGTLEFSAVGYVTKEEAIASRREIYVSLDVDALALENAVVVAYGTARREAVTGSVTSVKGGELASTPVVSVDKSLGGKLAGVTVNASTGQPGATSQIRIRGNSSINASNEPLWVVDGIPILNGSISSISTASSSVLATLNPNDIESITVLKDAAAAAVYGSRAAAGVILVTTKSGKAGDAQFNASVKYGVQWLQVDSGFRPMNGEELLMYQRDAMFNAGLDPDDPTSSYYRPLSLLNGEMTNWLKEFTRLGQLQEYEISTRGGTDRSSYYSSFSYQKNDGTFTGVDYQKMTARVNSEFQLLKSLRTGTNFNIGYTKQNNVPMESLYYENPTWAGLTVYPWIPCYNEDGSLNTQIPALSNHNPLFSALNNEQKVETYHINAVVFLRWEPLKNLVLESKNAAELIFANERGFLSEQTGYNNLLDYSHRWIYQITTSNTINYTNVFGGYHYFRALAGQEAMRYDSMASSNSSAGVNINIPYPNTTTDALTSVAYGFSRETMLSFFGIVDYNYDQKYFAQATVRADGSSLFGANNKWGLFWSGSASWNLNNEEWLRTWRPLDLLKLRASYGVNGNNGIAAYRAYGVYGAATYNGASGWLPSSPSNENLSWERNATWNVGVDFGFLGRIRGNIDVYQRLTKDMLLSVSVPYTTGFGSNFMNAGSMKNTGIEFQIDADVISTSDFNWNLALNLSHNVNEILDLGGEEVIQASSSQHHVVGRPMWSFYLKDYYGVNPSNGEALWVSDFAEDGSPILTSDYTKAREYYTSPDPKLTGGLTTTFSWKGLSLSAFFEFKFGGYVWFPNESSYLISDGSEMGMNQLASATNYWKKPGDTGVNPKPVANNSTNSAYWRSDRFLQHNDYVRIKDVTLSYTFPTKVASAIGLKGLRVYVSGQNLYTFNDVDYWNPDVSITGVVTGGIYPLTKSVVGGIEVSF